MKTSIRRSRNRFTPAAILLIGLVCLSGITAGRAGAFDMPRLLQAQIDWNAARRDGDPERLNAAAAPHFPTIAGSAVPVLLPFDAEASLRDREAGEIKPARDYLSGLGPTGFFMAGPSGYDATFAFDPSAVEGFADIRMRHPLLVTISGFAVLYDIAPPAGAIERPAPALAESFPGLRRQILESTLRYAFTRYGATYVVAIQCYEGRQTARRLSCRNAERVAQRVMQALRLAGGTEKPVPDFSAQILPDRPAPVSGVFTYYPPGRLIPGSGMRGRDGQGDPTVYARIRFPLAAAPAYANSQSFMHWGDCDQTGQRPRPRGKDAPYRCRVNAKPLVFNEGAPENYAYPWRDNFCEHRYFFVGQCPAGLGHQGQDIRPSACRLRNANANRCEAYLDNVVAARDGMILREGWQESFLLHVNDATGRIRFRYLHMHPAHLNGDRILSGRRVSESEVLGKVGNFNRRDRWTTTHLHFEVQVPTRDGWVRVNPYMTLVSAYERLIGARGTMIAVPDDELKDLSGHAEATSAKADMPRKSRKKSKRFRPHRGKGR